MLNYLLKYLALHNKKYFTEVFYVPKYKVLKYLKY